MPGYRFGKHPPKSDYRTLPFKNYLAPGLAPPPAELNVLARVFDNLHLGDASKLFPLDGNDQLGDCTITALAHAITVYRGLIGRERRIMSEQAVVKLYRQLTGAIDSGLAEHDASNYRGKHTGTGEKTLPVAASAPKRHKQVTNT